MTMSRPAPPRPDTGAGPTAGHDAALYAAFARDSAGAVPLTSWLAVLCDRVAAASRGVVLEADQTAGAFVTRAVVPDPRADLGPLQGVAEKALGTGRPATDRDNDAGLSRLAHPVVLDTGAIAAVVVLELRSTDARTLQAALHEMHWAAGWLALQGMSRLAHDQSGQLRRAAVALDLLAVASEHPRPEPAAMALVSELQTVMDCDQTSIGLVRRRHSAPRIRLMAMSYSAWFKKRSALAERLETAMEEALDQDTTVAVPPLDSTARTISVAHADHVRDSRTATILSTPLPDRDGPVGVISVERRRDAPFTEDDRKMLESVAALIGPVLELKRRNRRWIGGRLVDTLGHALGVVLGPRRLSWKLLALTLVALSVAAATVTHDFRISADAVLRGTVQRAVVAPFAGFIDSAPLRAGDQVAAGDVLARLEDADLRLETLRWRSELDRLTAQQRDALSRYERAEVGFLDAQIRQARAQLDLAEAELARTTLRAPIDGLIVSGDLSQRLGSPVQPGEVLFELAPLDGYKVDIFVDERDLRHVADGATGRLQLAGQPQDGLALTVTRITPVAEVREGANTFRVEASLDTAGPELRPGMEGVAKIGAGDALLVWIWTRRMIDWVRRTAWTWQP